MLSRINQAARLVACVCLMGFNAVPASALSTPGVGFTFPLLYEKGKVVAAQAIPFMWVTDPKGRPLIGVVLNTKVLSTLPKLAGVNVHVRMQALLGPADYTNQDSIRGVTVSFGGISDAAVWDPKEGWVFTRPTSDFGSTPRSMTGQADWGSKEKIYKVFILWTLSGQQITGEDGAAVPLAFRTPPSWVRTPRLLSYWMHSNVSSTLRGDPTPNVGGLVDLYDEDTADVDMWTGNPDVFSQALAKSQDTLTRSFLNPPAIKSQPADKGEASKSTPTPPAATTTTTPVLPATTTPSPAPAPPAEQGSTFVSPDALHDLHNQTPPATTTAAPAPAKAVPQVPVVLVPYVPDPTHFLTLQVMEDVPVLKVNVGPSLTVKGQHEVVVYNLKKGSTPYMPYGPGMTVTATVIRDGQAVEIPIIVPILKEKE